MDYFGLFSAVKSSSMRPQGHLKVFLETQRNGLGGHYEEMGYPFNTAMWDGGVGQVEMRTAVYRCPGHAVSADYTWWPYEQSAYLLDGLLKLGYLLNEEKFVQLFERNMNYLLAHPNDQGILGWCYNKIRSQWPMIVMTRALIAYYMETHDDRIKTALHRHFLAIPEAEVYQTFRHINMLEGILIVYGWTGDQRLLDKAVNAYANHDKFVAEKPRMEEDELRFSKLASERNFTMHGVSFSESVKLPVMLYMYTGNREYLEGAERGLRDVLARHEQIPGLVSANEYLSGRDPLQGYESCLLTDFTWSLGYFLMATGKTEYADRIEKIIYNALPGAISKDFTALQYFSSPNQMIAAPESCNTHNFYMFSPMRQYRPNQFPQCCPGNIQRAMPNFVSRMFLHDAAGAPVAALYGPVTFRDQFAGKDYEIVEATRYPYSETIQFKFTAVPGGSMPFTCRIPAWCNGATLKINGENQDITTSNGFVTVTRQWQTNDVLELTLPMTVVQKHDRQWSYLEYGPLVFSYPIPTEVRTESDAGLFKSLILRPQGKWNYALLPDAAQQAVVKKLNNAENPLLEPPVALEVPAVEVSNFSELEYERFSPQVPVFSHPLGPVQKLTLYPFGTTMLRVTAFPDAQARTLLPLYEVLCYQQPYPYDVRRPLSEQHFLPERLSDAEYRDKCKKSLIQPGLYCDLIRNLGDYQEMLGYVKFYFYAEHAGKATFMVAASQAAVGYYQGRQFGEIQGVSEAEFIEPQWFELDVQAGWTVLLFKVAKSKVPSQYYNSWGIKVQAFY